MHRFQKFESQLMEVDEDSLIGREKWKVFFCSRFSQNFCTNFENLKPVQKSMYDLFYFSAYIIKSTRVHEFLLIEFYFNDKPSRAIRFSDELWLQLLKLL